MYPLRGELLQILTDRVCLLAQSRVRLIRFAFTFIAMNIYRVLLDQYSELDSVMARLKSQPTLTRDKDQIIS